MATETRKAKSPYQRYGKTPFRYSELYYRWRAAAAAHVKGASRAEMDRAGAAHDERFGLGRHSYRRLAEAA